MDVKCDKCQARYRIDDARVGASGLTMRCGKCGNTFKVTKGGGTQSLTPSAPPAAKPAPAAPAPGSENATMMFAAPKIAPAPSKPAPAKAAAPAEDAAGKTMMFGAPPVLPSKPPPAAARPPPGKAAPAAAPADDAGSTMMFAASPVVAAKTDASNAAKAAAAKAAAGPAADAAGATMMFAGGPPAAAAAHAPEPRTEIEPALQPVQPEAAADEEHEPPPPSVNPEEEPEVEPPRPMQPIAPMAREQAEEDQGIVAEGAEEGGDAHLVPQPRKIPLVPIAIAVAVIVVAVLAFVVWKRFGKQPPSPAALDEMSAAYQQSLRDTVADYTAAESQAQSAIARNKRAFFPVGYATLAQIEVGWADALRDGNAATPDVKARLTAAKDALEKGIKQDQQSPDLLIAQSDYYRSAGSSSNYTRTIKKAQALAANDPRVAFVQGLAAAAEDDGADKALPLLKQAAAALPNSARVHFRYAQALLAAKQGEAAIKELEAALKLSPAHSRAKALLEAEKAKAAPPPQQQPPPEEKKPEKKGAKGK